MSTQRSDGSSGARPLELDRLTREYEAVTRGGVRISLVEGPPDAGKARLARDLRARVGLEVPFVEGTCDPTRPFGAFAGVVEGALALLSQLGARIPVARDALGCGRGCHDLWYQHTGPGGGALAMPSPDRRNRFFDAMRRLLAELARPRPPIVLLRHLERADRGTIELLAFLAEAPAPWEGKREATAPLAAMFVATVEEAGPSATWEGAPLAELLRLPCTTTVRIGALDRQGVARYLASDEVIDAVVRRTAGLPGRIDRLVTTELLPLEASVERELETASPGARSLMEVIAVIGQPASLDELERALGAPAGPAACAEIGRSPLVYREIVDGRAIYDFAETRVHSLVRRALDPQRRRELHRGCAELFATIPGREVDAAKHAVRAGDFDRAGELALAAWPQLVAAHAYGAAAQLLESLVQAAAAVRREIRERLVELYRVTGDVERAIGHAKALRAAAPDDAAIAVTMGELLARKGDLDGARDELTQAAALARASGDAVQLAATQNALAELSFLRRDLDTAAEQVAQGLVRAQEAASLPLELDARNIWGRVALARGSTEEAIEIARIAVERADRAALPKQLARALDILGAAEMASGHEAAAEHSFARSLEIATAELGEEDRAVPLENLALLAHQRCDYAAAQRHYHQAAKVLGAGSDPEKLGRVVFELAQLYVDLGDPFRARRLCSYAWDTAKATRFPAVAADGRVVEARIELAMGEGERAREAFVRAETLGTRHRLTRVLFASRLGLAEVAIDDGDVATAQQLIDQLPRAAAPDEEVARALAVADLARARGENVLVRARAAQDAADRTGSPRRRQQATIRLARALIDEGRLNEARAAIDSVLALERELSERLPEECRDLWSERRDARRIAELETAIGSRTASIPPAAPSVPPPPIDEGPLGRLIGTSPAMQRVKNLIARVAPSDATALIRGESGTGKELVAEALHRLSPRAGRPFVKVNCAAVVETLLASELFGHERGAFTGAHARKKGWFELADGGTLFLDEIGDISPKTQAALLRVLQHHELERVGGTETIRVDVRVIAATNRDLEELVRTGDFRQDLYYRLGAVTIQLPPLRNRLEDLPAMCEHLLARIAEESETERKVVAPEALRFLQSHRWPGNVRELENVLRSTVILSESRTLGPRDFRMYAEHLEGEALDLERSVPPGGDGEVGLAQLFYDRVTKGDTSIYDLRRRLERETIARALGETGGNITRAAQLLGMKRPRLSQLVKEYGLDR